MDRRQKRCTVMSVVAHVAVICWPVYRAVQASSDGPVRTRFHITFETPVQHSGRTTPDLPVEEAPAEAETETSVHLPPRPPLPRIGREPPPAREDPRIPRLPAPTPEEPRVPEATPEVDWEEALRALEEYRNRPRVRMEHALWIQAIHQQVNRACVGAYPEEAVRHRTEGKVRVSFRVDRQGRPRRVRVESPSGHLILDAAASAIVRRAAPFPAPPEDLPAAWEVLRYDLTFRM